jgi:FAD:protein FMN transferase
MGTLAKVIAPDISSPLGYTARSVEFEDACRIVERTFEERDRRFSRFRDDSELAKVNECAGRWTRVSEEFLTILQMSLDAARETDGLFDPTVLPALVAAGYDRDFSDIVVQARFAAHTPTSTGRWSDVEILGNRLRMPGGVALDFGGIAKGWTVDTAVERVSDLLPWVLVDAGGDLRIVGDVPEAGLEVAVEDPSDQSREVVRLHLRSGALATSSITSRAWGPNLHQLIDPRTWKPAATDVLQATVWAATCADAEVGSKWALLSGSEMLERVYATLVFEDGSVVTNLPTTEIAGGADLRPERRSERDQVVPRRDPRHRVRRPQARSPR